MARSITPEAAKRLATAAEVFFHALDTGILGTPGTIEPTDSESAYVGTLRRALAAALGADEAAPAAVSVDLARAA